MIKTRMNYKHEGTETTCRKCGQHEETTEHVIECYNGQNEKYEENCEDVEWLRRVAETYRRVDENNRKEEKEDEDDEKENE